VYKAAEYLDINNDKAIDLLNQDMEIDPGFARVYSNRGIVYSNKEDYGRAIADFERASRPDLLEI
jgi:tetratricopeptide (TPR) repeat protein